MRASRFISCVVLLLSLTMVSFGQNGAGAASAVKGAIPDYGAKAPVNVGNVAGGGVPVASSSLTFDAVTGAVISGAVAGNANINTSAPAQTGNDDSIDVGDPRPDRPTIAGLDTLATFDGAFLAQAGPSSSTTKLFRWTMVGNDPRQGGSTVVPFAAVTVNLQLLNADGSVFKVVPFDPFQTLTLESPNFEPLDYRSGQHIEYGDAVHRAQFFHIMGEDWHTILVPEIKDKVTITVPFHVNVVINGQTIQIRTYFTGTAADGSTFVLMLSPLFNNLFDNLVVSEINNGNFTTRAVNATLFPNTFLYSLDVNDPNNPHLCCVLGFHTYFFQPGAIPQPRWVTQYASWISPGLFGGGFNDVTALSHETAEIFGDPFLDNVTPLWQFPLEPANAKVCQGNLEEGDPIEVFPLNATFPITVKEGSFKFTYHPQNIPLLQWFEMGAKSDAIDGAFSFPDETLLPHSALPCPQ
jgi:hypothetical protein